MKQLHVLGALALLAALTAWPATAQGPGPQAGPQRPPMAQAFEKADADGDGKVTLDELRTALPDFPEQAFTRLDQDGDGALVQDEMPRRGMRRPGGPDGEGPGMRPGRGGNFGGPGFGGDRPMGPPERGMEGRPGPRGPEGGPGFGGLFGQADADEDGKVSKAEFDAAQARMFERLDGDGDGYITREELPGRFGGPMAGPQGREGRPERGDRPGARDPQERRQMARRLLAGADADGNGKVTLEEIQAVRPEFPEEAFQRMDTNGDGVISPDDAPADDRPQRDGDRGPRDGDRGPRMGQPGDRGPRDGDRGPRMGQPGERGPRDGDRGPETGPRADRPRLDPEQRQEAMKERFKEADTNGDGQLSFEEIEEGFARGRRP